MTQHVVLETHYRDEARAADREILTRGQATAQVERLAGDPAISYWSEHDLTAGEAVAAFAHATAEEARAEAADLLERADMLTLNSRPATAARRRARAAELIAGADEIDGIAARMILGRR